MIAVAAGLTIAGFAGVSAVSAQGFWAGDATMISTLAQKLGVSEDKVKGVFTEMHTQRAKEMQAKVEERLTQAVKEGKITQEQKTLILNKHKELQSQHVEEKESWGNMTQEERRASMQKKHEELASWAEQNGIDPTYLVGFGKGMKRGHRGMGL